jgi:serine/threonine protein kinase
MAARSLVPLSFISSLIGIELEGGWIIRSYHAADPLHSGGIFSHGFMARTSSGKESFVKVLDIRLNRDHPEPLKDLELRLQRFNYESDIALACATSRLSRVAHAINKGVLRAGPDGSQEFPYLVFERAAGDLRNQIEMARRLEPWICFHVLHNVAVAIQQLHGKNIAHQDVKSSNVLDYREQGHKLGDFGSAHLKARTRPGPMMPISGDPAPMRHPNSCTATGKTIGYRGV